MNQVLLERLKVLICENPLHKMAEYMIKNFHSKSPVVFVFAHDLFKRSFSLQGIAKGLSF